MAVITGHIRVVDATTTLPLVGAMVFVDSLAFGPTDVNGRVYVSTASGTRLVRVVSGAEYHTRQAYELTDVFPTTLEVYPVVIEPCLITLATARVAAIVLSVYNQASVLIERVRTNANGTALTTTKYLPGTYTVTAGYPGYTSVSTSLVVRPGATTYAVRPPQLIGNGSHEGDTDPVYQ